MRSFVAFALIGVSVGCWTTIATADDATPETADKRGRIVANAPREVDTTHGVSTAPDHAGASVVANLTGPSAGATANAVQSPAVNATATSVVDHGERYKGFAPASVSPAGVVTAAFSPTAGVAASGIGIDRSGAVASLGSVQSTTLRPMGTGVTIGKLIAVGVRVGATVQPNSVVVVNGVLNAAAVVTSRAVGVWNSATSMVDPVQRLKPARHKR